MSYLDIDNLYKNQDILLFKECYAMEKIHGTSAHVGWKDGQIHFFAGGIDHIRFVLLFDGGELPALFEALGHPQVMVYGEAYGGKCQGMSKVYGQELKFVAFEVKIGQTWLNVPNANDVARKLGFDFVHYARVATDIETLNSERDDISIQAVKNGMGDQHKREGIVLRPLIELIKSNGERIIAKHKSDAYSEIKTPRVVSADRLLVLADAEAIAEEWVTPMRLNHILQSFPTAGVEQTGDIIRAMIDDILREGDEEIVDSREARKAISKKAVFLFKEWVRLNATQKI